MRRDRNSRWWAALGGGIVAGIAVTLAITGVGRGGKLSPDDDQWHVLCDPAQPCPGTTPALVERCSCEPSALAFRNTMCFLDRHMRKQVSTCLGDRLSLAELNAGTQSCVETRVEDDPDAKALFQRYAGELAKAATTMGKAWNDCYRCWSIGQPRGCDPEAQR